MNKFEIEEVSEEFEQDPFFPVPPKNVDIEDLQIRFSWIEKEVEKI